RAVALQRTLLQERPEDDGFRDALADYDEGMARAYLRLRRPDQAMVAARDALVIRETLMKKQPESRSRRSDYGRTLPLLGITDRDAGDTAAAWREYDQARSLLQSLANPQPQDHYRLACSYALLCACPAPGGPPATSEGQAARQALADRAMDA